MAEASLSRFFRTSGVARATAGGARGLRASREWLVTSLLLLPGCGYLFAAIAIPIANLALSSVGLIALGQPPGLTGEFFREVFTDSILRDSLLFSFYIAISTTILSLFFATILSAVLLIDLPGRYVISVLYKIPLVVPGLIAAFLVSSMIGPGGIGARTAAHVGWSWPELINDRRGFGIILVLMWQNVPITMLIVSAVIGSIPQDIVDAARNLGAGPRQVFLKVIFPLSLPGISAAALIVFIDSFGTYAVPSIIGPVYPQAISVMMTVEFLQRANWGVAAAIGMLMALATAIVLFLYYRMLQRIRESQAR
jgi:putative spermidine/putrescine transport system permease protein